MTNTRDEIMTTSGCGKQIADDAVEHGYTPTLIRDNGKQGDARLALYQCGDVQVIDTNGDAIWDTGNDPDVWPAAIAELDA